MKKKNLSQKPYVRQAQNSMNDSPEPSPKPAVQCHYFTSIPLLEKNDNDNFIKKIINSFSNTSAKFILAYLQPTEFISSISGINNKIHVSTGMSTCRAIAPVNKAHGSKQNRTFSKRRARAHNFYRKLYVQLYKVIQLYIITMHNNNNI